MDDRAFAGAWPGRAPEPIRPGSRGAIRRSSFCAAISGLDARRGALDGLGMLLTHVVEPAWGIGAADERVNVWLRGAPHLGTHPGLSGGVDPRRRGGAADRRGIDCTRLRHVRDSGALAAFVVFALGVEAASYRVTTLAVHSHRPRVVRLESLAANATYPSGHTAAAIAVYGGLALLVTSRFTRAAFRAWAWAIAVLLGLRRHVAHVSRDASPAGHHGRGRHWRGRAGRGSCSPVGLPARRRRARERPLMNIAVIAHSGQVAARRVARAAARPRGRRSRGPALVRGAEEPEGARPRCGERSTTGADLIFAWGGDGMVQRCVDVLSGTRRQPCHRPGRDGESLRRQPRGFRRTSAKPSRSGFAVSAGGSTSAGSTASGSQSWQGPGSTRR